MITAAQVSDALALFSSFETVRNAVVVHTHCLYPDNAIVSVWVRGRESNGFRVSDEGRAIDELTVSNRVIPNADRFLANFCHRSGLRARQGQIVSPAADFHGLVSAILSVANASAEAVRRGLDILKVRRSRSLREDLVSVLYRTFPAQNMKRDVHLLGKTTRSYRFEAEIMIGGGRRLLIDPVTQDASSICSRHVGHFDIGQLRDHKVSQRLVYDDREPWSAADLNLLQTAAVIVPYTN